MRSTSAVLTVVSALSFEPYCVSMRPGVPLALGLDPGKVPRTGVGARSSRRSAGGGHTVGYARAGGGSVCTAPGSLASKGRFYS